MHKALSEGWLGPKAGTGWRSRVKMKWKEVDRQDHAKLWPWQRPRPGLEAFIVRPGKASRLPRREVRAQKLPVSSILQHALLTRRVSLDKGA